MVRAYIDAYSGLPAAIWWLSGVLLISRAGTMVAPFLSLYLTKEIGLTKDWTGLLIGCCGAGGALGVTLGGWLSDRVGPRPVMIASLLLSGGALLILGELRTIPQLAAGLFVFTLVAESFRPANGAALAAICPAEIQSRGFGLQRLALNVGMTIGPAVGGYLAEVRYQLLFVVNAGGCLAAAAFLIAAVPAFGRVSKRKADEPPLERRSGWRDGKFLLVMLTLFASAFVFFQLFVTLPVYFKEVYGMDEHQIGWLYATNTILIIATEMVLVSWLDQYAKLRVVAVGSVFVGAGLLMMPFGSGLAYGFATVAVWTVGEMMTAPFIASYSAGRAPQGSAGSYMGILALTFSLAHMLAPVGGLWAYEHWGPNSVWYLCGFLSVVIVPPLWWMGRK